MTRRLHRERMRWYSYDAGRTVTVPHHTFLREPAVLRATLDRAARGVSIVNVIASMSPGQSGTVDLLIEPRRDRLRLGRAHRRAAPDYRLPRGPLEWVRPPWARTWHYLERGPR